MANVGKRKEASHGFDIGKSLQRSIQLLEFAEAIIGKQVWIGSVDGRDLVGPEVFPDALVSVSMGAHLGGQRIGGNIDPYLGALPGQQKGQEKRETDNKWALRVAEVY